MSLVIEITTHQYKDLQNLESVPLKHYASGWETVTTLNSSYYVQKCNKSEKISDLIHYVYIFQIMYIVLYNYLPYHKHGGILTFKQKDCSDLFAD